ncbi:unnamed protein product [Cuscuta campestris]|uniref:Uncharacterized protein n=1 Tax=Cuscuta campestris TaxID=132261 RepID=A0A484LYG0_9ASTE|nr:unnamed protein product [Cuscuta campestris]
MMDQISPKQWTGMNVAPVYNILKGSLHLCKQVVSCCWGGYEFQLMMDQISLKQWQLTRIILDDLVLLPATITNE